jgi:DNA-directed RNA polymerase subunit RPC12/RpoP
MDVREKLVELLDDIQVRGEDFTDYEIYGMRLPDTISNEDVASHLIAHGVTVQECAEWEEIEDDWNLETIYKCSSCKEEFVTIDGTPADNLWNYCPNCGAKMMPRPPKGE